MPTWSEIEIIKRIVCEECKITHDDLISQRHHTRVAHPRHMAMWLCRHCTQRSYSYKQIASRFGGRDHSTAVNSVQRAEALREDKPAFNVLLMRLKQRVEAALSTAERHGHVGSSEELAQASDKGSNGPIV
jgi:chromosomal replication initiator protein